MAEFCLDCWNKINHINDKKGKYILSYDLELCEGCGEYKRVIIAEKRGGGIWILIVIAVICIIFYVIKG